MTSRLVEEPAGVPDHCGIGGLVRLRLDVAYDGGGFHGWARQPGLRSVQGELESALAAVLRIPEGVRVAVAGRTDAGVHATGQVCHCDVPVEAWQRLGAGASRGEAEILPGEPVAGGQPEPSGGEQPEPAEGGAIWQSRRHGGLGDDTQVTSPRRSPGDDRAWGARVRRRLNGVLAPDIRVLGVTRAPHGFDARWSAAWRRYEYQVADDPAGQDPRTRGQVLWHPRPLDVAAMAGAAAPFLGEHDFAAFCRARAGASSVRTIHEIGWWVESGGGPSGAGVSGAGVSGAGVSGAGVSGAGVCGAGVCGASSPGAMSAGASSWPTGGVASRGSVRGGVAGMGDSDGCLAGAPGDATAARGRSTIRFTVRADAFCHAMVRSLVGAFLAVGDGRWPMQRPAELLEAAVRVPEIASAPPHGLTLVQVGYPPVEALAEQAQRARRWRGR